MNSDQVKGNWNQLKGEAKKRWGKLSDDDLDVIGGEYDKLVGKLQERHGMEREEAKKEVDAFYGKL
ncbi:MULTISPECIES: CsbD family protein [Modicisalibacter]|uniref:CsbD family protein n=1 Tax=Modicisalibacter TaxID=574347 RepID=UPI00100BA9A5|nr:MULTISPECIES: CsbD family protein [Halomonadaceae]MBZ9556699.1 CsbD family protein [Modicisalibacter sp. R2A 31.J]MBZ9574832.1 CsbD family protein [Modicisalibacter sp. MOD 31.J]